MKYIATLLLVLMTASLAACGVLLWRRRKDTGDYSRYIQAMFSWVSALSTLTFVFRTWIETTTAGGAFFEPEHTFVPIIIQMLYFLYPLEVIKPIVSRAKVIGGMVELIENENEGLILAETRIAELEEEIMTIFDKSTMILNLSKK